MSRFNDLGIDIGQVSKLAHTELYTINSHVTLWSAEELSEAQQEDRAQAEKEEAQAEEDRKNRPEDEPESESESEVQILHKPSYYGDDVNISPAQRSKYHESTHNVAVALVLHHDVPGLESLPEITAVQINGPGVSMTPAEMRTFENAVAATAAQPVAQSVAPNSAKALAQKLHDKGGQLSEPSDSDIFRQTQYLTLKHRDLQPLSRNKLKILRDYMRFELLWKISEKRLRGVLFKTFRVLSYGMIAVSPIDIAEEDFTAKAREAEVALPVRKDKTDKAETGKEEWTEEQKKAHKDQRKQQLKRLLPPRPDVFTFLEQLEAFKQKEDTWAKFIIHEDQRDRTYMRLRTTHQYKDEDTPSVQPRVKTDVDFTFRNTRPAGDVAKAGDIYKPSHRILDVSNPMAIPVLQALYPHLAKANSKYWQELYASLEGGHALVLIKLHQNEFPSTSNLFTPHPEVSESHKHLRIVMRHAPTVFILVRGSDVDLRTESGVNRFVELSCYNPHSAFYGDSMNPYINDKGVKPTKELPKFTVLPENSFEDWDEFAVHAGVGTVIEHRFGMRKQTHHGNASAQPVPHSQMHNGLNLALCLQFSEEDRQPEVPRLTDGDAVTVDFYHYKDEVASPHLWKGKVVAPGIATAIGQVCIVVHRPLGAEGVLDDGLHTTLTATDLNGMTTEALQTWARENCTLKVTVFKNNDDKECKRLTNALDKMKVRPKEMAKYAGKERILKELRNLFLCKDHEQYSTTSLYYDVHEEDSDRFAAILPFLLKDYQLQVVESWINEGVLANTAILGGISGSGKTYTSMVALCAFLFRCFVDPAVRNMRLHEMADVFQDPTLAPALPEQPLEEDDNSDGDPTDNGVPAHWQEDGERLSWDTSDAVGGDAAPWDPVDDTGNSAMDNAGYSFDEDLIPNASKSSSATDDDDSDKGEQSPPLDKGKGRAESPAESVATESVATETPPADPTLEEPAEYEEGRITHACFQNQTVDHSYDQFVKILTKVCELMDVPMKLVIRCHSVQAEQKALMAMLDPEFDLTFDVDAPKKDPKFIKRNALFKGDTVEHLLNHYLRHFQTKFDGIADRRFQTAQGSATWVLLQLARFPSVTVSSEVINTWTEAERDDIAAQLQPIVHVARDLETERKMSAEAKKEVLELFKIGFRIVMERAPVVCCTASVANSGKFQLIRQANAVCIEEAGRGTDLELMGFFSNYWDAKRFVVGCWNQLGPNPYGPQLENPFQAQLSTSPLARFHLTGFPIQELSQTSRFTNAEMLALCKTLNNAPNINEVPGSFDSAMEQEAKAVNFRIWGIRNVIVAVNVKDVTPCPDSTGSYYCIQTALTAMHDLTSRLRQQLGHQILVITPYNAQVRLLLALRDAAVQKALQAGDRKLAKELTKVMIITVDSSMGKDRHVTILDTVGHDKGFFWRQPRTLVAGTRAKTSLVFIGPTYDYTSSSHIDAKNRLKNAIYQWGSGKDKKITTVEKHQLDCFEQYHSVQVALNLTSNEETAPAPNLRSAPLGADLTAAEYSDDEDDALFYQYLSEQIKAHNYDKELQFAIAASKETAKNETVASGSGTRKYNALVPPHLRKPVVAKETAKNETVASGSGTRKYNALVPPHLRKPVVAKEDVTAEALGPPPRGDGQ